MLQNIVLELAEFPIKIFTNWNRKCVVTKTVVGRTYCSESYKIFGLSAICLEGVWFWNELVKCAYWSVFFGRVVQLFRKNWGTFQDKRIASEGIPSSGSYRLEPNQTNVRAHSSVNHVTQGLRKLFDQPSCSSSTDWKQRFHLTRKVSIIWNRNAK